MYAKHCRRGVSRYRGLTGLSGGSVPHNRQEERNVPIATRS